MLTAYYTSESDSDHERPEGTFASPTKKQKRPQLDFDEKGEPVEWGKSSFINPGNITTARRSAKPGLLEIRATM